MQERRNWSYIFLALTRRNDLLVHSFEDEMPD